MKTLSSLFLLVTFVASCYALGASSDPDHGKNTSELILSRGYKLEIHDIETKDGFLLKTFRIINPKRNDTIRPVILQHGLMFSSREWLIAEPKGHIDDETTETSNSLAYELAKQGYDVWLPNSRGNSYSQNHRRFSTKDAAFWDFTTIEMAKYDVPAVIDYVLAKTGYKDLAFIGHSAGTMQMFGTLSFHEKYNELVRPFIALAPVMSLGNTMTPLRVLARTPFLTQIMGNMRRAFLPSTRLTRTVEYLMCRRPFQPLCTSMLGLAYGFNFKQLNTTRFDVFMSRLPAGTSTKNMMLFLQGVKSGKFADFDYGRRGNQNKYSQNNPPEVPIEKITNKHIVLMSSKNDFLASPTDVNILRTKMGALPLIDHVIPDEKFNHLDFKLAKDVGRVVNRPVVDILKKFDA